MDDLKLSIISSGYVDLQLPIEYRKVFQAIEFDIKLLFNEIELMAGYE